MFVPQIFMKLYIHKVLNYTLLSVDAIPACYTQQRAFSVPFTVTLGYNLTTEPITCPVTFLEYFVSISRLVVLVCNTFDSMKMICQATKIAVSK